MNLRSAGARTESLGSIDPKLLNITTMDTLISDGAVPTSNDEVLVDVSGY